MTDDAKDATDEASGEVADEVVDAPSTETAVALIDPLLTIQRTLVDLKADFDATTFDVETTAGEKAAREFRARCVKIRTAADAAYAEGNKPLLKQQKLARDLVAQIKKFVEPLELTCDAKITAKEKRKATEKAAREEAERKRVGEIRQRIAGIGGAVLSVATATADEIDAKHSELVGMEITAELFGDFVDEATGVLMRSISDLASLYERAKAREVAEAELKRQQEEIKRQKAELAERQAKVEADAKAERDREAAEKLRVEKIKDRLQGIREYGLDAVNLCKTAAEVQELIEHLRPRAVEERDFEEFYAEAVSLKSATLLSMTNVRSQRIESELEAYRVERQRIENEERAANLKRQEDAFAEEKLAHQQEATQPAAVESLDEFSLVMPDTDEEKRPVLALVDGLRFERPDDDDLLDLVSSHFGVPAHVALDWLTTFDVDAQVERIRRAA